MTNKLKYNKPLYSDRQNTRINMDGGFSHCGIAIIGYFFLLRQFQAADKSSIPAFKGDGQQVKAEAAGASMWLQRPETSRGRRYPTPTPWLENAELPTRNQNNSLEDEGRGQFQNAKQMKKEEKKSLEREDSSLTEKMVKKTMDKEVETEGGHLVREREKEKQMLLQEGLKREEEEQERRLWEEDEERLR